MSDQAIDSLFLIHINLRSNKADISSSLGPQALSYTEANYEENYLTPLHVL